MFRTKPTRTERLKAQVVEVREQAAPMASDAADRVREAWGEARDRAAPMVSDLAERAKPKVEAAESTIVDSVLPKVGAALGAAAGAFAQGADEARERVREAAEPRMVRARDSAHLRGERARDAYRVLSGEAVAKPKRGKGRWLLFIGLLAAAVAGMAAYRKQQQANDPWATPYPGASGYPPSTPAGGSLKDKAVDGVEHAKEAVSDAAGKAKDKAAELAAKGQSAIADAKDRSAEAMDDHSAGQVSSVDPGLDSDAITSDAMEGGTVVPKGGSKQARRGELT